jgi:hypothetical protein
MSITLNKDRIGNFTSSQAYRLVGIGSRLMTPEELAERPKKGKGSTAKTIKCLSVIDSKFETYVDEKRRERKMNRAINVDVSNRSTAWGDLMEKVIHEDNPLEYFYNSSQTTKHPTVEGWSGSNDFMAKNCVVEAKGYQPDNFSKYYECLEFCKKENSYTRLKEDFPQEYWQLVSGSAIHGVEYAEAILYMPYFSDLPKVFKVAFNDDSDNWQFKNICDAIEQGRFHELPYLPNDSEYKDRITFRFKVPQEDKDLLTNRVKLAVQYLNI